MKIDRTLRLFHLLACLIFAQAVGHASTIITSFSDGFPNNGQTSLYQAPSFTYWYSLYQDLPGPTHGDYNIPGTNDPTMDYQGNSSSGSMYVYAPWTNFSGGDQNVFYITFADDGQYDSGTVMQVITITNLSWYIHVDPSTQPDANGNFGTISGGLIAVDPVTSAYDREDTTYLTIPGAATNGWVKMSETNAANFVAAANSLNSGNPNNAYAFGVAFDQNSYGTGYPTNTVIYWIDQVTVQTATAPPPPPPPPILTINKAVPGLNLFAGDNSTLYNREDIESVGNDYSWVGASGPVTYSFTITNYPIPAGDGFQTQIFLIPNPGTESAPDYNEANAIFLDMEANSTGASVTFRYKTNNPDSETMPYAAGALASISTSNGVGTWSMTFTDNTNVMLTAPGNVTTNFSIPDSTGATTALFASGVTLYFGVQAGNVGGANDHIVASDFSVTGLGSADFNDNFEADAAGGGFNPSLWKTNATFPTSVQLVGPGNPYWLSWTTPAPGFTPEVTGALSTNIHWTVPSTYTTFDAGSNVLQLINTNDLPTNNAAFFALVQRTFTQLLVLLPGETNAPGTATGKSGTPTPVSLGAGGAEEVTVMAVDSHFYPVPGETDQIGLTASDSSADLPTAINMANGVAQFTDLDPVYFNTEGTWTITATDQQAGTTIPPATSSPVTVGP